MEICMSVTVKAVIPDNEVVPIETLVQAIKEQHMDAKIVEAIHYSSTGGRRKNSSEIAGFNLIVQPSCECRI